MKKCGFNIPLFLFFLLPLIGYSQNDSTAVPNNIELKTFILNDQVAANREVVYNVELTWSGELDRYKILDLQEPAVTGLTLRGSGSKNKVTYDSTGMPLSVKRITFYFLPVQQGMAYINGITIRYEDKLSGKTESLVSSRIGVKIIEPVPENDSENNFVFWAGGAFLLILIAVTIYAFIYYNRKKEEARQKELESAKETTEQKYLRLQKENVSLAGENTSEKIIELSRILSGYLSEKFHIHSAELESANLSERLQNVELKEDMIVKIEEFYKEATLVKFAGDQVSDSKFHQMYDTVELILTKLANNNSEQEGK